MVPIVKASGGNWLSQVTAGLVYAMIIACISTILLSLLLAISGLKEQSLPAYIYFIHGLSVFIGGFVTAKRAGEKGWYRGGLLGVVYGIIVALISYLGFDASLSTQTLYFLAICFIAGAFGGMLGINARRR